MGQAVRALLLGDHSKAPYHPVPPIWEELRSIASGQLELDWIEDYHDVTRDQLQAYSLCISYTDCWKEEVSDEFAAALKAYTSFGGRLLVLHNGISLQVNESCYRLIGARFTGHPPYQPLRFHAISGEHEIMQGITSFELEEEPYEFEFHPEAKPNFLLEYELDGERRPAAWTLACGAGRIVYLMPGHHAPSFRHPVYQALIQNSVRWLLEG